MSGLLQSIFGHEFKGLSGAGFREAFFAKKLTLVELGRIHKFLDGQELQFKGRSISSAMMIGAGLAEAPIMLMTQLHGNEPAGLAAILYVLALESAGQLRKPVIALIGNHLAGRQYFEAWAREPKARQEVRDLYRRGKDAGGKMLADMNRLPNNFRELDPGAAHYVKRWQEMDFIADNCCGVIDIHSARGDLVCMTESSDNSKLVNSPITIIMSGLTGAIGAATESSTFKTVAGKKANIVHQFGIEAGTHEDDKSFDIAARFGAALLYNIGFSAVAPETLAGQEFFEYLVRPKLAFADLEASGPVTAGEVFYTAKPVVVAGDIPAASEKLVVESGGEFKIVPRAEFAPGVKAYAIHQYEEAENITRGQIVAVSVPGGIELKSPGTFFGVFIAKSAEVYDDAAIGLYPVAAEKMDTKFCYPCDVRKL